MYVRNGENRVLHDCIGKQWQNYILFKLHLTTVSHCNLIYDLILTRNEFRMNWICNSQDLVKCWNRKINFKRHHLLSSISFLYTLARRTDRTITKKTSFEWIFDCQIYSNHMNVYSHFDAHSCAHICTVNSATEKGLLSSAHVKRGYVNNSMSIWALNRRLFPMTVNCMSSKMLETK